METWRCKTCGYWKKTNYFKDRECRRRAPVRRDLVILYAREGAGDESPVYPHTDEDHWCGEYVRLQVVEEPKVQGIPLS